VAPAVGKRIAGKKLGAESAESAPHFSNLYTSTQNVGRRFAHVGIFM
jgi:hypothetical protein